MAKITKPLTHTEIQAAKAKSKVYALNDGGGLQLRIKPTGVKTWLFSYYRPYSKVRTTITFGSYPALPLAAARKQREEARKLLARNIDPKDHRDEQERFTASANALTLKHIAAQWLEVKRTKVTPEHADDSWRSLELHIFPALGAVPIHKITAVRTIEVIRPIAAKGSLETVKRLAQRLNEVMTFAVNTGLITQNPLTGIREAFQRPVKQHQPTLTPDQLPTLMQALSVASIKITTRCLIEWQLHTMVRPGEAAGTRWDEVNFDAKVWTIPPARMKQRRAHSVPLTEQALTLLELMRPISGRSPFVFQSDRNPRAHTNPSTANMALKRMGFDKTLVAHGLRALASTTLNDQGFDADLVEAALAHTGNNEVRNAYNRADYLARRIPMMNWWSKHIDAASSGNFSLSGKRALFLVNG